MCNTYIVRLYNIPAIVSEVPLMYGIGTRTALLWLRYVDNTFTAVHKDGINDFHEHLNRQNADRSSFEWFSQPRRSHLRPNPWRVYTIHDTAVCFPGTICSKIRHSGRCPPCPIYRFGHCRRIIICYHIFRSQRLFAKSWRSITGRHKRICRKRMRRFG